MPRYGISFTFDAKDADAAILVRKLIRCSTQAHERVGTAANVSEPRLFIEVKE